MLRDDLSDEEIIEAIMEGLKEDPRVDVSYLKLEIIKGIPVINGRVASDDQIQAIDEIMADVLEIEKYENNVWVDDELAFEANEDKEDVEELSFDDEEDLEPEDSFGGNEDDE
ncbi:MAG: hypothetical protein ACD_73C00075G0005 [uncultured bacterium]|nr:MAG: hypothetical protein ACD_73C00075G0005 [uncultured bacterium]